MTLHSDWMVRAFSLFMFLFGVTMMVGNGLVVDQGQWLVLGTLVGILCAGWKWTRRHLFRRATADRDGIRWSGLCEGGAIAWSDVVEVTTPPRVVGFQAPDFSRVVLTYYKNDRKREITIASYWSTYNPEQDAAAFIAQAPEPYHDKLRSRLVDREYGGLPTTQRAREWRAQARAIRRRSDAD